ncbi:hypothetical protein COV04_04405 [Candidatus Uhrbacteria bacterium CG10_big_fil_rev_8_21_14_0_10_48_11]|uniref:Uncharacterized protein n=1 Tax=Candidatus Uhrbacteria bacterium CG10_big_fil_rev_8_21_14_0_10_48_11 TaxID=1975037 RepID=A0A2M8LDK4_9BACT|nr:MAG: hypothetical protein COV04_04405 [Candidatus Uhrbacteria bacterium CG10_big_fil_rev_8_21_14_0_10_48_11]
MSSSEQLPANFRLGRFTIPKEELDAWKDVLSNDFTAEEQREILSGLSDEAAQENRDRFFIEKTVAGMKRKLERDGERVDEELLRQRAKGLLEETKKKPSE